MTTYKTTMEIFNESELSKTRIFERRDKLSCLKRLFPTQFDFPDWVPANKMNRLIRPSNLAIRRNYLEVVQKLRSSSREHERTSHERALSDRIRVFTRKTILPSVWIGNHCIDLFIPNVRSQPGEVRKMRGLAIEVDGNVHDLESKMRKDQTKSEVLQMIGIGEVHIPNLEFNEPTVLAIQKNLKDLKPLDSRERRRVWRRIELITIALQMSDDAFYRLFTSGGRHD